MTDPPPTRRRQPAAAAADATAGPERTEDRAGREPGELVTGLSPRQIIGGFALLAGLIIWLRRRGRGKG
jgi:predicted lipid-binding transport protein (Tim44 family)